MIKLNLAVEYAECSRCYDTSRSNPSAIARSSQPSPRLTSLRVVNPRLQFLLACGHSAFSSAHTAADAGIHGAAAVSRVLPLCRSSASAPAPAPSPTDEPQHSPAIVAHGAFVEQHSDSAELAVNDDDVCFVSYSGAAVSLLVAAALADTPLSRGRPHVDGDTSSLRDTSNI